MTQAGSYTLTASNADVSWSCSHPTTSSGGTGGPGIQQSGAQTSFQNANLNINGVLDGVIGGSVGSTFQPFGGDANGVAMMVAPGQQGQVVPVADAPRTLESDSPWRLWMAGRYTHASGAETGDQFNGLVGTSYRLGTNKALGLFAGYEGFNYTDVTPSRLSGNGLTLGGFVAGTFDERLKLDARAYTTIVNYNITLGTPATGTFSAQRLGSTVSASYELGRGATSVAPFVRGTGLFEWQNSYTDSAAAFHASQYLAQGILSPGLRLAQTINLENGGSVTPYLAGQCDYGFGNTTLAGFTGTQGLSGRLSAGAQWQMARGISLGLDASYGGLGSTISSQSVQGTLTIPF